MSTLLTVLLVALVAAFVVRKRAPGIMKILICALLAAVFAVQGLLVLRSCRSSGGGLQTDFHEAAAEKLGRRMVEDLPEGGMVLVIQGAGRGSETADAVANAQKQGLERAFEGTGITVRQTRLSGMHEEMEVMMMSGPFLPQSALLQYLQEAPNAAAVVSCVGSPFFEATPARKLPPFYLLEGADLNVARNLIRSGIVRGGVFFRRDVDWDARPRRGMSLDEVFDMRYLLVTPENLDESAA